MFVARLLAVGLVLAGSAKAQQKLANIAYGPDLPAQTLDFFEKRSKNLYHLIYMLGQRAPKETKVFCFFFSKKKAFLSLSWQAQVMDEQEVYQFLRQVLRSVFGREIEPTPVLSARDVVGWDSLKQVEITLALEEEYGVRIRTRELNNVANVGDLVRLVVTKANV